MVSGRSKVKANTWMPLNLGIDLVQKFDFVAEAPPNNFKICQELTANRLAESRSYCPYFV